MFPEGRLFEFLIAATVALIVVGPKDLPILLRKLGQFMAKVRAMAAEFRASFDEMARQSELDELRKEVEAMRTGQMSDMATHAPEVNQAFNEISQGLSDVGVDLNVATSTPYVSAQTSDIGDVAAPKGRSRKTPAKSESAKKAASTKSTAKAKSAPKPPASKPTPKPSASKPATKTATKPATTAQTKTAVKPVASAPARTTSAKPRARKVAAS